MKAAHLSLVVVGSKKRMNYPYEQKLPCEKQLRERSMRDTPSSQTELRDRDNVKEKQTGQFILTMNISLLLVTAQTCFSNSSI